MKVFMRVSCQSHAAQRNEINFFIIETLRNVKIISIKPCSNDYSNQIKYKMKVIGLQIKKLNLIINPIPVYKAQQRIKKKAIILENPNNFFTLSYAEG